MQVIFTALAERQIDDLHREITLRSGFEGRADRYVQRIIDFCLKLETFPERGTRRDDILPGLRIVGFEKRVVIALMVMEDTLLIEGIFYGGQNYEAILGEASE